MDNFNKTCENGRCDRTPQKPAKPEHQISRRRDSFGLFDPFFDDFFRFPDFRHEFKNMENIMKTDVEESANSYKLEVEMPGFDKGDISIDLNNGYLTIAAKQNSNDDEKDKKGNYIRRERYFGSCSRSFYVGDIDEKDIDAKLERGVLTVCIPKEKKEEPKKRIEIK